MLWCCLRVDREGRGSVLDGDDCDGMGEESLGDDTKRGDCGGVSSCDRGDRSRAIPVTGGEKSCFVSIS